MMGQVRNGLIILDDPTLFPEGARAPIELFTPATGGRPVTRRRGEVWKGLVRIADDFDEPPDGPRSAFKRN